MELQETTHPPGSQLEFRPVVEEGTGLLKQFLQGALAEVSEFEISISRRCLEARVFGLALRVEGSEFKFSSFLNPNRLSISGSKSNPPRCQTLNPETLA